MKKSVRSAFFGSVIFFFVSSSIGVQAQSSETQSQPEVAVAATEKSTAVVAVEKVESKEVKDNVQKVESESKPSARSSKVKTAAPQRREFSPAISDNSFLIEEAYNQEVGVMQTISTCNWYRRPQSDVACTITQEFPLISQKHQISYTAPFGFLDSSRTKGPGDLMLNYRYQLTGESNFAVVAPRISLVLPTGSYRRGLGTGAYGLQFNLPVSKRLSNNFVAHFNAGATFLRRAKAEDNVGNLVARNLQTYNLGGSIIWLASKRFNVVFESVENFAAEIDERGKVGRYREYIANPGVRFAVDIGPLQIVPGFSAPTSFANGQRRSGVFFYLSFEHPFKKSGR